MSNPTESEIRSLVHRVGDSIMPSAPKPDAAVSKAKRRLVRNALLVSFVVVAVAIGGSTITLRVGHHARPVTQPDHPGRLRFQPQIWSMNADGSDAKRLTNSTEWEVTPAWSPDGTKLAFTRYSTRPGDFGESILIMNADGSGQRRLTHGSTDSLASWSPDGRQIAFMRESNTSDQIMIVSSSGGEPRKVADGQAPSFSPVSDKILFGCQTVYICEISASGASQPVRLMQVGCCYPHPTWITESSFTYSNSEALYLYDMRSRRSTRIAKTSDLFTERDSGPGPNGGVIYSQNGLLFNWHPNGKVDQITFDPSFRDRNPEWSPQSRRIVFERVLSGATG
ncbi:MAG: hypothetical protein ACYDCC_12430 [Actinomycetota bacterium]